MNEHPATRIYSIGHSTRALAELVALLREHGIQRLADIRRFPGSRRYPHFSKEALSRSLPEHGVEYIHVEELGGRRAPAADSANVALHNEQFRGYADHMATAAFRDAVEWLLADPRRTAVMCAEAVPWRCHRNLLADDLVRRGVEVIHIIGRDQWQRHELNPIARIDGDRVVYANAQGSLL
ncbi:MAG TPA: DUF488 domain-containing protein [Thermoanaerobaculia bacterium]|nr:DUF488 domain-containing protein [Thermoanaerobaculia bacterium]